MKDIVWTVLLASLSIAVVACTTGVFSIAELLPVSAAETVDKTVDKTEEKSDGPPPLVVDKAAPLLLDEPPEFDPFAVPTGPVADNSACFVCHANYDEEPFAVVHAKANCGCIRCHGASLAHRDDENNITPPDVMFSAETMNSNCNKCHDTHDAPAVEVLARWQKRCPEKTDPKSLVCTDCHGMHRLKFRTVEWDKKTGELIVRKPEESDKPKEPGKSIPDLTKKDASKQLDTQM